MRLERVLAAIVLAAIVGPTAATSKTPRSTEFPRTGLLVFSDGGALSTVAPDGSRLRALGELGAGEPRWSPGGGRIAYADEEGRLWQVRSNGSGAKRLTRPARGARDSSPAWSPRGHQLVHRRDASSPERRSGLRAVAADGSRGAWLSPEAAELRAPSMSPDGRHIVGNMRGHVWMVDADGSNARRLLPRGLVGRQPRFAPDGRRIAFVDAGAGSVRVVDLRTGHVRMVFAPEPDTYDVEYVGWDIAWSPDGGWLAIQWTNAVECVDDPTTLWCERAEIWIVSTTDARRKRIHAGPLPSVGNGLDWRRP